MNKTIDLELGNGKELVFNIGLDDYNGYVNKVQQHNKIQPAHNFLMSTVTDETKPNLKEVVGIPGAVMTILQEVLEEYQPDFEVTVKKSKAAATKSDKTE